MKLAIQEIRDARESSTSARFWATSEDAIGFKCRGAGGGPNTESLRIFLRLGGCDGILGRLSGKEGAREEVMWLYATRWAYKRLSHQSSVCGKTVRRGRRSAVSMSMAFSMQHSGGDGPPVGVGMQISKAESAGLVGFVISRRDECNAREFLFRRRSSTTHGVSRVSIS
jgi:hypothetical protein